MKGLFLIVDEHEGWASYWHLDPALPRSCKGKASTECSVKASTKLFIFQGIILKLNHILKMRVLLYAALPEEVLIFPSLRTITFLSFCFTSQRGAGWYKLQQQFSGVTHAVVSEKFGKSASGAPVLFSFPTGKMVLIVIEPGPAKEMSIAGLAMLAYTISQPPDMVSMVLMFCKHQGRKAGRAGVRWAEKGRKPLHTPSSSPSDLLCLHWACLSLRAAGREEVGVKL